MLFILNMHTTFIPPRRVSKVHLMYITAKIMTGMSGIKFMKTINTLFCSLGSETPRQMFGVRGRSRRVANSFYLRAFLLLLTILRVLLSDGNFATLLDPPLGVALIVYQICF